MYWRDRATLINEEKTIDGDGYKITKETRRTIYVNKKSATRSEFYTAKQAGEKIALVLEVPGADYHGEMRVEHKGRLYEVVRAYTRNGEKYELNCKQAMEPPQDGADGEETAFGKIRAIKKALSAAGMTWPGYVNASDKDGQHHIFECETAQEAGDG